MRTQRVTPDDVEFLAFYTGQPIERDVDAGVMACTFQDVAFYAALPGVTGASMSGDVGRVGERIVTDQHADLDRSVHAHCVRCQPVTGPCIALCGEPYIATGAFMRQPWLPDGCERCGELAPLPCVRCGR